MKNPFFLLFIIIASISSCKKEKSCHIASLSITFKGFDTLSTDSTKFDTITLKSFTKNSLYNEEITIDEIVLQNYTSSTNTIPFRIYKMNNLIYMEGVFPFSEGVLASNKDWEISFNEKTYRINSINEIEKTIKVKRFDHPMCGNHCFNTITEYMMNNEIYQNNSDNSIIIQK